METLFHRRLVLFTFSSFLLFLFFLPSRTFAQTTIRERVIISPRPQRTQTNAVSATTSPDLFHPIDTTRAYTNLPGVQIGVSGLTVNVPTPPTAMVAGLYIELWTDFAGSFPLKRYWICDGAVHETNFTLPTVNLMSCQQVYLLYKLIGASGFGRCDARDGPYKFAKATVSGSTATFQINDIVFQQFFPPLPVSATVTVSGAMLPGFALASVRATPAKSQLQCMDTTKLSFTALNGNGQPLALCSGTTLSASASIQARGPYAYLRLGTQEGTTINFTTSTASSSFVVVLDTTKGFIPQGFDVATVHVTVEGVTKDTTVNLSCPYPLPSVSILRPRDTTIVLSSSNQPTITFEETHTPTTGKFAPTISWNPGRTINTTDYFSQIQDSLVLMVRVKAQNVAADTAVDSTRITLKKQTCALVQFAKQELSPGDTTMLTFKKVFDGGALGDFPSGQLFDVVLENASGSGFLLSSTGTTGATLIGVPAPVYYVAPDSLAGDSLVVSVHAVTSAQTSSSLRRTSSGRATISLKKAGLGGDSEPTTNQLSAYELQLYARIAEACPAPGQAVVIGKVDITVSLTSSTVSPFGTDANSVTTVTIQATRRSVPIGGVTVNLEKQAEALSGGHIHTSSRPTGGFFGASGVTDLAGSFSTQYAAPEVAGIVKILASSPRSSSKDSAIVTVKVEGLLPFNGLGNLALKGETTEHPGNHYLASQSVIDDLINAASSFALAKWNATGVMRLNDMSLESGGLFDINNDWTKPHNLHRVGKSVDIENLVWERVKLQSPDGRDSTFTVPKVKWVEKFVSFMETELKKWKFVPEGQTLSNVSERTRQFPHFEWNGN